MGGDDAMVPDEPKETVQLATYLTRLDRVLERLMAHATETKVGHTAPDDSTGERWESGQVWAHLAEFGDYWLGELEKVVAAGAGAVFGRTKADPQRIAAIEDHRHRPPDEQLALVEAATGRLRAFLMGLDGASLRATGRHPTLGEMDVWAVLDEFLIGHYEQHADQLDSLRRVSA